MPVLSQEIYLFHYSIIYIVELEADNKIKCKNNTTTSDKSKI